MSIRLAEEKDREVLMEMVNDVYSTSEAEFWSDGYYRINDQQYDQYTGNGWLYLLEDESGIVGCVLLKFDEPGTSCFSMLVCHPDHRKKGIGKMLVNYVTEICIERGDRSMRLELLTPKDWIHEEKVFLKTWYESIGYVLVKEIDFLEMYPTHKQFMKCDLVFSLYEKPFNLLS
ncbi:MAG: GNAT superfamily N-acetyltransferase [Parvicellaceae bacterium]|jgi:GNAT superfamily N-acetyltransferase